MAQYLDETLFDLPALLPPLDYPLNLLPLQAAARSLSDVLRLANDQRNERRGRDYDGRRYAWSPTAAGPTFDLTTDRCHPAILSLDLRCNCTNHRPHAGAICQGPGDLIYRHWCAGCGHADEARESENSAVEDAMDHAWKGWRELPVMSGNLRNKTHSIRTDKDVQKAIAAYPSGWLESGGPVRTNRSPYGTRHVPKGTPWGGYDLGNSDETETE